MNSVRLVLLAGFLSIGSRALAATAEGKFLADFKKYDITGSLEGSKKPCLCTGGTQDGKVGVMILTKSSSFYFFECFLLSFGQDGTGNGLATCRPNGGTVLPLSK
jgi:hypothetical protein